MLARRRVPDEAYPLLYQGQSLLVGRMGLAGDDELHRARGICQQAHQSPRIVQQQVWPLVGCEAAREAQRQGVRIEQPLRLLRRFVRCARGGKLTRQAFARIVDERLA